MWFPRLLARLQAHPGPVLIEGGEVYGAPFLIDALSRTQRLAWLKLTPTEAGDAIAIGNRLADAVNRALEVNFLPYALPFNYNIELLKKRLPLLEPMTIVLSNPEFSVPFRDALLELTDASAKIILVAGGVFPTTFQGLHLRQEELALSPEEAAELAGHYLSRDETQLLWRSSGGAYTTFKNSVCRLRGAPLPYIPSPQGDLVASGDEALVSPPLLLDTLQRLGRHIEALDLAVMSMPERVAEMLEEAGPAYQAEGLLARLHLLLTSLDDEYQRHEKVLEWRLMAGFNVSDYSHILPGIEAYLEDNEAPELRARYAGVLSNDPEKRFAQAQRAAAAAKTPLTLFQLGRAHPDGKTGHAILQQSVKTAEALGRSYDVTRNAWALAESLIYLGRFHEAAYWGDWALQLFDKEDLKDGPSRLYLLHICAAARIIIGQHKGLEEMLSEVKDAADSAELDVATDIRAILANLELVQGKLHKAERLATANFERSPRWRLGDFAVTLVRVLLEQGKVDEALSHAQYAVALTAGEDDFISLPASLALGMAHALKNPDAARSYLTKVLEARDIEATFRITAALHLLKIGALRFADLEPEMQKMLLALPPAGFRLFCGPEAAFAGVWNTLLAHHTPLRIRVLGQEEVWLNGKRLALSERSLEILVLLALRPEGLSPEVLHDHLYSDENTTLVALRSAVSRLRALVPISSYPDPYRISVPFTFDARDCEEAISVGDVRTALELYQGPLLAKSDAPAIREARLFLEEQLRQSVMHSGNAEALLPLAETLRDDLELWQAAHAALAVTDTRLPLVRAQLHRVTQELRPSYN